MLILDIPRKTPEHGAYLSIPVYHRTHLGLSVDTTVHYCLLPALTSPGDPVGSTPELVIAPFPFDAWAQIWRLTVTLTDKPGLLYEIASTLRHFGVSIVATESAVMEERGLYHTELIIHITDDSMLPWIEWTLLARLFDSQAFLTDGSARLRFRRVLNLWRVKQSFDNYMRTPHGARGEQLFRPLHDTAQVESPIAADKLRSLRLRLPQAVREILRNTVAQGKDWGYHLRISDTKDRFLRVLYFRSTDPVIHARVEHGNRVGAIADLTLALKHANFTLITVLSTPSELNQRAITEFVVRAVGVERTSTADIKTRLEHALALSPAAIDLELKIGYPGRYAAPWAKKHLRYLQPVDTPSPATLNIDPTSAALELLTERQRTLGRGVEEGTLEDTDRDRWVLLGRLFKQYEILRSARRPTAVFISCQYAGTHLEAARRLLAKREIVVVTGQDLERFPTLTEGLVERIQSCSDFLGIWSDAGAYQSGDQRWPSPWLLWELGVASGFGINWRLLISEQISKKAWEKLASSKQHTIYNETNFETKLAIAIDALLTTPVPRRSPTMQAHYLEI